MGPKGRICQTLKCPNFNLKILKYIATDFKKYEFGGNIIFEK